MAGENLSVMRWNGLDVQVSGRMSRTPGYVPDRGTLVWRRNTPQPASSAGKLEIVYNNAVIDTWKDCRLSGGGQSRSGMFRDVTYTVEDRRWRWKWPTISGNYNVRDDKNKIKPDTKRTPNQLLKLILAEMWEIDYDISAIPDSDELLPEVHWSFSSCVSELKSILDLFGCNIHLMADDTIKVFRAGVGALPDMTGATDVPDFGISVPIAPDAVRAISGPSRFDCWLRLRPVAIDMDGEVVENYKDLSFCPPEGFTAVTFGNVAKFLKDQGANARYIDRVVQHCESTIFRKYEVDIRTGPVESLIYDKDRDYSGFGDDEWKPFTGDLMEFLVCGAWHSQARPSFFEFVQPGVVTDKRQLMPLMSTRLATEFGEDGISRFQDAELIGFYTGFTNGNVRENESHLWTRGFSVDPEKAMVTLNTPGFRYVDDDDLGLVDPDIGQEKHKKLVPALLWLRCGFVLRRFPDDHEHVRGWTEITGVNNGTRPDIVRREDLSVSYIQKYENEFSMLNGIGIVWMTKTEVASTELLIDAELEKTALNRVRAYYTTRTPQTIQYIPPRAWETDGIRAQVTYQTDSNGAGSSVVSLFQETDYTQPPSAARFRTEQLTKKLEAEAGNIGLSSFAARESLLNSQFRVYQ